MASSSPPPSAPGTVNENTLAPELMQKMPIPPSALKKKWDAKSFKQTAHTIQSLTRATVGSVFTSHMDGMSRVADFHGGAVHNKADILKRMQMHNIRKMTQLCSFVPDFIMMDEANRKIPYQFSSEAVVLMADISGFTALTETYSLRGKGGTDQLTKTLAGYIGPLVECVLQADGDIVKYAGDAFIAYWKTEGKDYIDE